jgi:omega-amidase
MRQSWAMRIAVAQMDCEPGDVAANAATAVALVGEAAAQGAGVVVLPELADIGYLLRNVEACAAPLDDHPYLRALMEEAALRGVVVISGLTERDGDRAYNTVVVTDGPGSVLTTYRKHHLWAPGGETEVFSPGEHPPGTFELNGMTASLSVCFDLRFPQLYRPLAEAGAQLFVVVGAWPFPRLRHWTTLLAARAIENQSYVVAANRVGTDGRVTLCGSSVIVDPYGTVVASADEVSTTIAVGDVDAARVATVRRQIPVL